VNTELSLHVLRYYVFLNSQVLVHIQPWFCAYYILYLYLLKTVVSTIAQDLRQICYMSTE